MTAHLLWSKETCDRVLLPFGTRDQSVFLQDLEFGLRLDIYIW